MISFHRHRSNSSRASCVASGRSEQRLGAALGLLALGMVAFAAGPVSAQSPQAGTPAPAPSVPPADSPRTEVPSRAAPELDLSEEDDDDGEGCPYLGQPLELLV